MKIISLRLENFQGIRDMYLEFGGKSAAIYGANEAGKTTIYNAITWLLFGQASTGAKNFTPKTIDESGELHNLNHSVEAVFECADSSEVRLSRVYHEVYTKKRGSASESFTGHTTEYYVDGVPVAEREYVDNLESLCGSIETMRLLTMPDYFPERIDWQARRKLLLDVCGDVTDADVIAADPDLYEIAAVLKKPGNTDRLYTVEEYRSIAQHRMVDINRDLQGIPARIDEANKAIPVDLESAGKTWSDVELELGALRQEVRDIEERKNGGSAMACAKAKQILLDAEAAIQGARQKFDLLAQASVQKQRDAVVAAQGAAFAARTALIAAENELSVLESRHAELTRKRETLAAEYNAVESRKYEGDDSCPTCGRRLPEEMVAEAVAAFNVAKSTELSAINQRGQICSKDIIADIEKRIASQKAEVSAKRSTLDSANAELAERESEIEPARLFDDTKECAELTAAVEAARKSLETVNAMHGTLAAKYDAKIEEVRTKIAEYERLGAQYQLRETQRNRIEDLKTQEKGLAAQYEELERGIALCEQFVRSKVSMLTSRINNKFSSVSFILFSEQINGGLKECCEVAVPAADGSMIPFAFANTAARINAGLEIIGVLSAHFGVSLPVVVDNAESVTYLNGHGIEQLIRLIVSPEDIHPRLEVA